MDKQDQGTSNHEPDYVKALQGLKHVTDQSDINLELGEMAKQYLDKIRLIQKLKL